jgi:hypothetical protein
MKDSEFFSNVDIMLGNTLMIKPLVECCTNIKNEIIENADKLNDDIELSAKINEDGEKIIKTFLENLGYTFLSKSENIPHDYQFVKKGKQYRFEIKTEFYDSKNIEIEYEHKDIACGLSVSKSDFLIKYYPLINEVWLIKIEKLKSLIKENIKDEMKIEKYNKETLDGVTKMFLLKKENLKDQFRITNAY